MDKFRRVLTVLGLAAMSMLVLAGSALAQTATPPEEVVGDAVSSAAASASGIVTAGIPILLGVAALWVALKFGKRLLAKIG